MSNAHYELLPSSPAEWDPESAEDPREPSLATLQAADRRFNPPTPSPWKRVALVLFLCFLFWLSYRIPRLIPPQEPEVVYADRYSNEYKYRPAASPVITEALKNGKRRIKGANPTIHRGRVL